MWRFLIYWKHGPCCIMWNLVYQTDDMMGLKKSFTANGINIDMCSMTHGLGHFNLSLVGASKQSAVL